MNPSCADESTTARRTGTRMTVAPCHSLPAVSCLTRAVSETKAESASTKRFMRVSRPTSERISTRLWPQELPLRNKLL